MAVAKFKKTELTVWQSNHNSEARRAEVGAVRVGFETALWERIRLRTRWTKAFTLYRDSTSREAHQIRRYLHKLDQAGLIETRHVWGGWERGNLIEFRVLLNAEES